MPRCTGCSLVTAGTPLHKLAEACWYGGSRLAWLLLPFSAVFMALAAVRRRLYLGGWLQRPALPVPVVVVGNITVGGTGKTPVVAWLVGELQQAGYRPAIVARGYGGVDIAEPCLVRADADPAAVGDEPVLLARQTGVAVIVCRDRVAAVREAARQGANIVVADDGLQHYRMRRIAELIVLDGARGLGNGWYLPAGPLREGPGRLKDADAVLVNGGTVGEGVPFMLRQGRLRALDGNAARALSDFAGIRVFAVAGIGNPARFYAQLRAAGVELQEVPVPDHGRLDLAALRAGDSRPVLMTAKDAVKYAGQGHADVWVVPVSLEMSAADRSRVLEPLLDKLKSAIQP